MQAEKTHKSEGIAITIAFHAALLLLFFFMMLTPPNPPLSQAPSMGGGGVELNFGEQDAGTGDLTNLLPTNSEPAMQANTEVEETPSEEDPTLTETAEETVTPTESENAVAINAKEQEKEQKTEEKKAEVTKPVEEKKQVVNQNLLFKKKTGSNTSGTSDKAGEDKNKAGNTGNRNGTDEKGQNLMGEQGKGGGKGGGAGTGTGVGFGDGFAGWEFVGNPLPNDESPDVGRVEFTLTTDQYGDVINAIPSKNFAISPSTLRIYINHLKTLSLVPPPGVKIPANGYNGIKVWYTINNK